MLTSADKFFLAWVVTLIVGALLYVGARPLGLGQVPGEFWGVLVGSGFTIRGVSLSNKADRDGQARQFDDEHRVKSLERLQSTRRDDCMDSAIAIQAGVVMLARIVDVADLDSDFTEDHMRKAPATAKASLVSNLATLEILQAYQAELMAALLQLTRLRAELRGTVKALTSLCGDSAFMGGGPAGRAAYFASIERQIAVKKTEIAHQAFTEITRPTLAQTPLIGATRRELARLTNQEAMLTIYRTINLNRRQFRQGNRWRVASLPAKSYGGGERWR